MNKKIIRMTLCFMLHASWLNSYGLPGVNLGLTNILDGGPIRPTPGSYLIPFFQYYSSHNFLDNRGQKLGGIPSPRFSSNVFILEYFYQFTGPERLNAQLGIGGVCYVANLHISPNSLGFRSSGTGFGNIWIGAYLQWNPIFLKRESLFVHRVEFDVAFPVGKNKEPFTNIDPTDNFIFINPYWAGTLFFSQDLALSWRIHYLWNDKDHKTDFQPGQAIHTNFSFEYQLVHDLFVAINGYFLQQITNNKQCGLVIPHSKERVAALGVGSCYFHTEDLVFFANFYDEFAARNRTQGIKFVFHFVAHF